MELIGLGVDDDRDRDGSESPAPGGVRGRAVAALALVAVALVFLQLIGADGNTPVGDPLVEPEPGRDAGSETPADRPTADRLDALVAAGSLPPELVAAEVYHAAPGPETLRSLLGELGGLEAVTVATAAGSFDLVTFNPTDPDRLAASFRSSYGPARNHGSNQAWRVMDDGEVLTSPLTLTVAHDFAHFNADGTMSYWWHAGSSNDEGVDADDFAPRVVSLGPLPRLGDHHSDPVYPSRAVIVDQTLFALTGDPSYYSTSREFVSFIADRGEGQVFLDDGTAWGWVDAPAPGIVVTYPAGDDGVTAVWSTATLDCIDQHHLAGRSYRRAAVSGDGTTMVGVTFGGTLETVDIASDRVTGRFGRLDPSGIATPVTLNHDGTIAVTVDHDGTVTIWWVGDPEPIAVIEADAGPLRLLSEYRAPRASSTVAPGAGRVAVRHPARPGIATRWSIIDTDPARWIDVACQRAGRSMTPGERAELGLGGVPPACR